MNLSSIAGIVLAECVKWNIEQHKIFAVPYISIIFNISGIFFSLTRVLRLVFVYL